MEVTARTLATVAVATCLTLAAQSVSPQQAPPRPAKLRGTVVSDLTGNPLRRARVTLLPRATGLDSTTVETDENGRYEIPSVTPGPYGLQATRDGFLANNAPRAAQLRLPRVIRIMPGDDLKDVTFRLQPWAVIDGTVRFFDDRDPAMNVPVYAYQKVYLRGQKTYAIVGRTRTDDRGYYRLPGLPPGTYLIAAVYNKPVDRPKPGEPVDPEKIPEREPSYSSVFYPNGDRITDALPVQVTPGQELRGYDMYLRQAMSVRVRGKLTDDCTGRPAEGAPLEVVQVDDDGATIPVNAEIQQLTNGQFIVRGLAPGPYEFRSSLQAGQRNCPGRSERQNVMVADQPIDTLELHLSPDRMTLFDIRRDGKPVTEKLDIRLEPRSIDSGIVAVQQPREPGTRGRAVANLRANEEYTIFVSTLLSEDDYQAPPYKVVAGGVTTITFRADGARVAGRVQDPDGKPIPGAVITFVPDTMTPQLVREGYTDQYGNYEVSGLAPGTYNALPWLDAPPCDIFNPNARIECAAKGRSVTVKPNDKSQLDLTLSAFVN
ncbi:hypothetical protein F183_A42290 [Bryobacterales bacterium F-183]|nr:hypothetical protein F183_A42290 [Bryobacterales bacterium F-183]